MQPVQINADKLPQRWPDKMVSGQETRCKQLHLFLARGPLAEKCRKLDRDGLEALIERQAARRLAALGGAMPSLEVPPRRRPVRLRRK